jgi:SPP1 family phage portal protein
MENVIMETVIFTTDKKGADITPEIVARYIKKHVVNELPRLNKLERYYKGLHDILERKKSKGLSNITVVTNHAAYIADMSSSYLIGEPATYTAPENVNIDALKEALKKADAPTQDMDLALNISVFGRGFEMLYMSEKMPLRVKLARLSPKNSFVVYDDTVEQNPVFGVYFFETYDDNDRQTGYKGQYSTDTYTVEIILDTQYQVKSVGEPVSHYFGDVPIIEYYNNGERQGDFEQVMWLIDAYNLLQSDRMNDKEQFVDAVLLIKGQVLGDTPQEELETYQAIKQYGVISLDADSDASFLTRQFDEAAVDILRKAIVSDIHKISRVPDMTDENFVSNSSGVAMKYKLLGLEQLAKIKERYFVEGLQHRLRLFQTILNITGQGFDVSDIDIKLGRSLPANELEEAQTVATLGDNVPVTTKLSYLSAVKDPEAVAKELEDEQARAAQRQRETVFNTPLTVNETVNE